MNTVLSAIVPVFLVAGGGYVLRRCQPLDAKAFSTANIYVFIPALVFANLSQRELNVRLVEYPCAKYLRFNRMLPSSLMSTTSRNWST